MATNYMNWNNFQVPGAGGMPDYGNFTQGGASTSNSYSSLTGWGNNLFDFSGAGGSSQYGATNNLFDANSMGGGSGNGYNSLYDPTSMGGGIDPNYTSGLFTGADQVGVASYQSLNSQYGVGGLLDSLGVSGASNTGPPSLGNYVAPPPTGGSPPAGTPPSGSPPSGSPPAGSPPADGSPPSGNPPAGSPPSGSPPAGSPPADSGSAGFSSASGNKVTLFGGSQSGENNVNFTNKTDKDMYVYAQKGLQPGEKDPGGTVFKVPAGGTVTVSSPDNNGLRYQKLPDGQAPPLDANGVATGVTAPAQTGTLYESLYDPSKHLSWDDISPLDGANIPMTMSGNGGRTVHFTQAEIDGAPDKNPDGTLPGIGPDPTSTGDAAKIPELKDYYKKTSLQADGTRDFYYNSSVGGDADKANVGYTGAAGQVRTTVDLG